MINGNVYVGKSANVRRRWATHRWLATKGDPSKGRSYQIIHRAMKKHGIDNFFFEITGEFETEQEAFDNEMQIISDLRAQKIRLYNLTNGGEGYTRNQDSKTAAKLLASNMHLPFQIRRKVVRYGWREICNIRNLFADGLTFSEIARMYNADRGSIRKICLWKCNKHSHSMADAHVSYVPQIPNHRPPYRKAIVTSDLINEILNEFKNGNSVLKISNNKNLPRNFVTKVVKGIIKT